MDRSKLTCADANIADKIELIVEGHEDVVPIVYKLYKDYITKNESRLCKADLEKAPFAVAGRNDKLLCFVVPSNKEMALSEALIGYGIEFIEAFAQYDGDFTVFVVAEEKATERVMLEKGIEKPFYCYVTCYDIGLSEEESVSAGIIRGVGLDGVYTEEKLMEEIAAVAASNMKFLESLPPERLAVISREYNTPEKLDRDFESQKFEETIAKTPEGEKLIEDADDYYAKMVAELKNQRLSNLHSVQPVRRSQNIGGSPA